jgi:hypothetical protein
VEKDILMANIKISELTAAAAATGTQEFEVNDSLTSKKVTGAQVLSYVHANTAVANVNGLQTALDGKLSTANGAVGEANLANNAVTTNKINNGAVTVPKIGATGTANNTTFLRGDGSWQTISTTPTTQQVLEATAGATAGAVGTYAIGFNSAASEVAIGDTIAGSNIRRTNTSGTGEDSNFSGTWRNMGAYLAADSFRNTVWLRIS